MYDGPVRGGNRGGQGLFRWSDVKDDKHRENYLGHTVNAPVGRWQNNKDVHWYTRDKNDDAEAEAERRREEIKKLKEQEEDALAVALGFAPADRSGDGEGTGSNNIPVKRDDRAEKEERRKEKELRKEQRAQKQAICTNAELSSIEESR
ncbi:hypothetical protein Q8F55_002350 [Vanrija albida]|uniref:Multiple myeloma tumor-associated protein 2-like N-terminal domain-containing protein n=1 Tax=Vanrija albida TaxID=181172 RepID=A0ABR3Q9J7_9TREE